MLFLLKKQNFLRFHRHYSSKIHRKNDFDEMSSTKIRNTFLDYFVTKNNHKFIRSSPVIPFCDPTVPFVNAGMNQFKNVFLGKERPPCKIAANSQKCIRIGGKHNDLDVIGTDGYHHTFFEMLGSWSFGDYFKEHACRMAWDLLTNNYMIDSSRLYVTYFGGDEMLGLKPDLECREIWRSIGLADERILPFGAKDNFWDMGSTGPCGTCTEIHIDHLPNSNPKDRSRFVNAGRADLTELWNIVFIEYNRKPDGSVDPLPSKCIDTGMGFERLVAILQGKSSNYDTDLFLPIFNSIAKESKTPAYSGVFDEYDSKYELDFAYRLVADHTRMCSVCIADGMYPKQNHRLQKIVRKTINMCEQVFKSDKIIQNAIIPQVVNTLAHVYPELEKNFQNICETFSHEAELYKSLKERTTKEFKSLNMKPGSSLTVDDVVDYAGFPIAYRDVERQLKIAGSLSMEYLYEKLHIGYGLTEEIIEKIADEKNFSVDMAEFVRYKQTKRNEAKTTYNVLSNNDYLKNLEVNNVPKTDYQNMYDYEFSEEAQRYVVRPVQSKIQSIIPTVTGDGYHIILNTTNFYHTAGGQDADIGRITDAQNITTFNVESVEICNGYVIHTGRFENETKPFQTNQVVTLHVDSTKRTALAQHHTSMHLLQAAMKQITGQIVFQQSSHVSHLNLKCELGTIGKRLSIQQLDMVERLIRNVIASKVPIETHRLAVHELYALDNLTTVPGATYPDLDIRVLKVIDQTSGFVSIEPCCGTHAKNTAELNDFCFTSFKLTNNGTYDIVAISGPLVHAAKEKEKEFLHKFELFKGRVKNENNTEEEWRLIQVEVGEIKKELAKNQLPYLTKSKILSELEEIEKSIRLAQRMLLRRSILCEMQEVLALRIKNNDSFIVHVLNTPNALDNALMLEAERMCHDLPVILLNVANNKLIQGRASIPLKYTNEKFNAKHWFQELLSTFKVICSSAKKRTHFTTSVLPESSDLSVDPHKLEDAIQQSRDLARQKFSASVSAHDNQRQTDENALWTEIIDIKTQLVKENRLRSVLDLEARSKQLKSHMKDNLYLYTTRAKCITELVQIDEDLFAARYRLEKEIMSPYLSTDSSIESCALHIIETDHTLLHNSLRDLTDFRKDVPIIVINVSNETVCGRISVPLKYIEDNFTTKHLSDEFNSRFEGKCLHDGTRFESAVNDFVLNRDAVNVEKLKNALENVRKIIRNALNRS